MKKIGPCKILRKFATNAYGVELPKDIGISPIFNVADLYPYRMDDTKETNGQEEIQWEQQMPIAEQPQIEKILDQRIVKKSRRKTYFEYLVKWKDHPMEDVSWITEVDIQKHGKAVWELMDRSPWIFCPEEYDARASSATFIKESGGQLSIKCTFKKCFGIQKGELIISVLKPLKLKILMFWGKNHCMRSQKIVIILISCRIVQILNSDSYLDCKCHLL